MQTVLTIRSCCSQTPLKVWEHLHDCSVLSQNSQNSIHQFPWIYSIGLVFSSATGPFLSSLTIWHILFKLFKTLIGQHRKKMKAYFSRLSHKAMFSGSSMQLSQALSRIRSACKFQIEQLASQTFSTLTTHLHKSKSNFADITFMPVAENYRVFAVVPAGLVQTFEGMTLESVKLTEVESRPSTRFPWKYLFKPTISRILASMTSLSERWPIGGAAFKAW